MITPDYLLELIGQAFDVPVSDITSPSRKREHVAARDAYALVAVYMGFTIQVVAEHVNRDYSSIYHCLTKSIQDALQSPVYKRKIQSVILKVKPYETKKQSSRHALFCVAIDAII